MRAFARTLCGDATASDDLAQDAMVKAWAARASFQTGTNMKAWAFMILRNQFYSEKRRTWRESQLDQDAAERTLIAVDDPASPLALDELRMALAMLPAEQREALILVGAGGFAYEEVAEICGCALGTAKSRVSRARRALQDILISGDYVRDKRPASDAIHSLCQMHPPETQRQSPRFPGTWRDAVKRPWRSMSTIRIRLTAAMAAALLPVLMLGAFQAVVSFQQAGRELRQNLANSAERSAAVARARVESADILLQTLAPGAVGFQCAQRLGEVIDRIPGYLNLIRFDRQGRVVCSARTVPADPGRAATGWFRQLAGGGQIAIARDPRSAYASEPAVLAAARADGADGAFDGAVVAVISLSSLQPQLSDPSLPRGAEVGLADAGGGYITVTRPGAFPRLPADWKAQVQARGSLVWYGRDTVGQSRVYSA
eukprot:gene17636-36189_t